MCSSERQWTVSNFCNFENVGEGEEVEGDSLYMRHREYMAFLQLYNEDYRIEMSKGVGSE